MSNLETLYMIITFIEIYVTLKLLKSLTLTIYRRVLNKKYDIFKDIKTPPKLVTLFSKTWKFKDPKTYVLSPKESQKLLDILCKSYRIPKVKKIIIDNEKCSGSVLATCCAYKRIIYFQDKKHLTPLNLFHEYAHYLDYVKSGNKWNQTASKSGECNNSASQFYFKLRPLLYLAIGAKQ